MTSASQGRATTKTRAGFTPLKKRRCSSRTTTVDQWLTNRSGDKAKIIEYAFDYTTSGEPTRNAGTMTDVHPRTRLGVAAVPTTGIQPKRVVVYQTNDKSLKWRLWPGSDGMSSSALARSFRLA